MVFSSIIFLFFFLPIVVSFYFLVPNRCRNLYLLIASLIFYTWGEVRFVFVMLASCLLDYVCGWIIASGFDHLPPDAPPKMRTRSQKIAVATSVIGNLCMLGFFKYSNFAIENVNDFLRLIGFHESVIRYTVQVGLPLGISFYTFQSMSYTIDIYRRNVTATRNFVDFTCFVTLFPQLIAGPIVRYRDIAQELSSRNVTLQTFVEGLRLFMIGLGKKVLIANTLAEPADRIFAIPVAQLPPGVAWSGALFFTLQLYFDFSGYSDMAIGLGRMFGFHFPRNFNYPYICKTAAEFWQRWHITLSTWLRDYVFVPLGGYRCRRSRALTNIMITFFLCGLWHGASWNYILFGVIPGALIIIERITKFDQMPLFKAPYMRAYSVVIVLIMVIFRTETLGDAGGYIRAMFGFAPAVNPIYVMSWFWNAEIGLAFGAGVLGSMPFAPWMGAQFNRLIENARKRGSNLPAAEVVQCIGDALFIVLILVLCAIRLAAGTHNPFIYFRF